MLLTEFGKIELERRVLLPRVMSWDVSPLSLFSGNQNLPRFAPNSRWQPV